MNRRTLLTGTILSVPALLVACAGLTPSQAASDLATFANAANAAIAGFPAGTLSASQQATLNTALTTIQQGAAAVSTALASGTTGQNIVNAAEQILTIAAPIISTLLPGIGTGIGIALGAIKVLLPVVASYWSGVTVPAAALAPGAAAGAVPVLTVAQARALYAPH